MRISQVLRHMHVPVMTFLFHVGSSLTHPIHELCFTSRCQFGHVFAIVFSFGIEGTTGEPAAFRAPGRDVNQRSFSHL